jgi:protocatechuate 3,4-dioxygenase beta subunit
MMGKIIYSRVVSTALLVLIANLSGAGQAFPEGNYDCVLHGNDPAVLRDCQGGGTIAGTAVNAVTGQPQPGAHLVLRELAGNRITHETASDSAGHWSFYNIVPGHYRLRAFAEGFLSAEYSNTSSDSGHGVVLLIRGQDVSNVLIRLSPLSVVTGRIVDEQGDPLPGIDVQATRIGTGGEDNSRPTANALTNDLGEYRLYGLIPGTYYVSAIPDENLSDGSEEITDEVGNEVYIRTFHPRNVSMADAIAVTVKPGQQVGGTDISLQKTRERLVQTVTLSSNSSSGLPPAPNDREKRDNRPIPANCLMAGRVLNGLTGEPIRRAQVVLRDVASGLDTPYKTRTDGAGNFVLKRLRAGTYRLFAEHIGFLPTQYGNDGRNPAGTPLVLKSGETLRNIVVRESPAAVITGRVINRDGGPLSGAQIGALRFTYTGGKRQLHLVASATSNDLGEYRLYGLAPANYYVNAELISSSDLGQLRDSEQSLNAALAEEHTEFYVKTFYPQSSDLFGAQPVSVKAGDQVGGIDIWVLQNKLVRIRGRITNPVASQGVRGTVMSLMRNESDALGSFQAITTSPKDAEGNFEFRRVTPGSYILSAISQQQKADFAVQQTIEIKNEDVTDLQVVMALTATISGRVRTEGDRPPNLRSIRVLFEPESSTATGIALADVKADGTFSTSGILPVRYRLKIFGVPDTFYVRTIQIGLENVENQIIDLSHPVGSIEIVLSPAMGMISGSVLDEQQQRVDGAKVVLVPDPPHREQYALYKITSSKAGAFELYGVAPGDYKLFAWRDVEPDAYFDPDFLANFEDQGRPIGIDENGKTTTTVQVASAP